MWRRCFSQILILLVISGILVWDLRKVKQLSDVIHDDHKAIWSLMNKTSMDKWYTPYEVCLLKRSFRGNQTDGIQHRPSINCTSLASSKNHLPSFCLIGSSTGSACSMSSAHSHFLSQLRDYDLGPNNQHLLRFLKRLTLLQKPLVFLGDTISRQNFNSLICEALRTRQLSLIANYSEVGTTYIAHTFRWKISNRYLSVYFMHLAHVFTRSVSSASLHDKAYDHDPRFHPEYSDGRIWEKGEKSSLSRAHVNSHESMQSNYSFRHHKRQSLSGEEIRTSLRLSEVCGHLNELLLRHKGVVIVANVGVWYNTRERFRNEILPFLQVLALFGERNEVFFRETSAQHWNHSAYGYFLNGASPDEGSCAPLQDSSDQLDWRNREVRLAMESIEQNVREAREMPTTPAIHILPFRDLTVPLHDMHPNVGGSSTDCTRFCYMPQMWQSIWRDLDEATAAKLSKLTMVATPVNVSAILNKFPDH